MTHSPSVFRSVLVTFFKTLTIVAVFVLLWFVFVRESVQTEYLPETSGDYMYESLGGDLESSQHLLFLPVRGTILGQKPQGVHLRSVLDQDYVTYGSELKRFILDAAKQDSIAGLVLEIDSPGGTVFGAQMVVDAIETYKQETGKPVYAHVVGLGASAAYWIASACDKIYAEVGTLVGSVGVVAGPFKKYDEVVGESYGDMNGSFSINAYSKDRNDVGGIHTSYITAGKHKDFGNPYRWMTKEEKTNVQRNIDEMYDAFVEQVTRTRDIEEETLKEKHGALVFVDSRAKSKKFIDETANREYVLTALAEEVTVDVSDFHLITVSSSVLSLGDILSQVFVTQNITPLSHMQAVVCGNQVAGLAYHGDASQAAGCR